MTIEVQKKKDVYIFNLKCKDLSLYKLFEFEKFLKNMKQVKSRLALDLSDIENISANNFAHFLKRNNLSVLCSNHHILTLISLTNSGVFPPIFLSLSDLLTRKHQFVKRNFKII